MVIPCSSIPPYQPSPKGSSGRPAHRLFRGLLSVHSRYGLHTRAVTVFRDTLNRRLQPFRYLHSCSGCFRLERIAGRDSHPLESAALSQRTPNGDTRADIDRASAYAGSGPSRQLHRCCRNQVVSHLIQISDRIRVPQADYGRHAIPFRFAPYHQSRGRKSHSGLTL